MLPVLNKSLTNWIDEFFNDDWFDFDNAFSLSLTPTRRNVPSVNIKEDKNEYRVEVAAPGLTKKDFKIELQDNILTISAKKEEKHEEKDEKVLRQEFNYTSFQRSFSLPETVEPDKIKASHKDGILIVHIPKKETAKQTPSKEIPIS